MNAPLAVILAAGSGQRMRPLSDQIPKPLLPIGNKPIIQFQLEALKTVGVKNVIIVIGYQGEKIKNYFGNGHKYGLNINYVNQTYFIGIAHAVGLVEDFINKPFFLFLGDIFADGSGLSEMYKKILHSHAGAIVAATRELDDTKVRKNFSIVLEDNFSRIRQVIEKPRYITSNLKGCGIYLFTPSIFDAIRNTPRTAMRDEYELTTSIQIMVNTDIPVHALDCVKWDINVTTPEDLLTANLCYLHKIKKRKIVGKFLSAASGVKMSNSIIGNNVILHRPTNIINSLILDNVIVDYAGELKNSIVTNNEIITFRG